ncbi:uncharacterized protein LOC118739611 isoform X1 [Rhagoletis pomonella]|uniref:uncharacterized protein LOC118739611 isoform X1 n=1 Tax=Rhagoletis pomonella TaxID=28610 RepID=UPI0017819935|nr:uncharacterized protein LOC118739611 isoform X1 [Rhagoletis pomonella]
MLFAACTTAAPKTLQHTAHAAKNLGQQQLTTLQQLKDQHALSLSPSSSSPSSSSAPSSGLPTPLQMSPQHHQGAATGNAVAAAAVAVAAAARANDEAKEAMRKLDAKLVAYLAGDTKLQPKQSESELDLELNSQNATCANVDAFVEDEFGDAVEDRVETLTREELQLFRRIKSVKLQLEALTLEPEGTKRMELLQNDIRPIFTVECQLSHELIKHVPRYEMFNIMQFESEKFHSLTQCTRFGQESQRDVNLTPLIDELDCMHSNSNKNKKSGATVASAADKPNFGRIHFAVWWREPGTCLNEMLGMGVFELRELYDAALLEQCKRITIQRRGVPLANIYLKINLLLCASADSNNNSAAAAIKQHHPGGDKQQETNRATGDAASGISGTAMSAGTAATSSSSSNNEANAAKTKDNNDVQVGTSSSFNAETLKIRLLTGLVYACEVRDMVMCLNREYHLVCERFWKSEPATSKSEYSQMFYYQEQFAIIRDANFLNRVKRKHLKLQICQRPISAAAVDNNGNPKMPLEPVGVVLLPLHQFFIAFSNEMMANRLVTEKLPVISIDAWTPILGQNGEKLGEIKCLLAIGSEEQIKNLKLQRGFRPLHADMFSSIAIDATREPLYPSLLIPPEDINAAIKGANTPKSIRRTVNLMEMLQEALEQTQSSPQTSAASSMLSLPTPNSMSSAAATQQQQQVQPKVCLQERTFQFELYIDCAASLPLNPSAKGKGGKNASKRSASKRFPAGEPPTTYVTFQADECSGSSGPYKSHEGNVYATDVVERSTHPRFTQLFLVTVGAEYLENPKQNFILKLWKKANVPPTGNGSSSSGTTARLVPKPIDDAIIGFTALDLGVFLRGMHIGGTFNVIDFNGRMNGQLQLSAKPMEGWYVKFLAQRIYKHPQPQKETQSRPDLQFIIPASVSAPANNAQCAVGASIDNVIEQFGNSLDLTHLNLSQAVKHKFNELEGISKRLRTRLSSVTGEPLPEQFDAAGLNDWRSLNDVIGEELPMDIELNEFERDINLPPLDDVTEMVNANEVNEFERDINKSADAAGDDDPKGVDDNELEEAVDDNKGDKKENLISKTAPGAADPIVE